MSEHSTSIKYFVIAAVALAIVVAIYAWVEHSHTQSSQQPRQMTAVEKSYLGEVTVTDVKMSAASNFLGATVYYLDGSLTNKGSRTLRDVALKLTFMDPFGEVVLVDARSPVTPQTPPLKANSTQPLHLVFEHLPAEWNQGPPAITTTSVSFR